MPLRNNSSFVFVSVSEDATVVIKAIYTLPPIKSSSKPFHLPYPEGKSHVGRSVGRNEKRPERGVFIEALAETKSYHH
jgi:hypothetical protein